MRRMGQIIIIKSTMIQLDIYVVDFGILHTHNGDNYRRFN